MNEEDLLKFLLFIAEEDAQISTIINFFTNKLGYDIIAIKNIVDYGVKMNILKVVENDKGFENLIVVNGNEIKKIDWSTSNNRHEIHYNDFVYYRKQLFVSHPKIPQEFRCFISEG